MKRIKMLCEWRREKTKRLNLMGYLKLNIHFQNSYIFKCVTVETTWLCIGVYTKKNRHNMLCLYFTNQFLVDVKVQRVKICNKKGFL